MALSAIDLLKLPRKILCHAGLWRYGPDMGLDATSILRSSNFPWSLALSKSSPLAPLGGSARPQGWALAIQNLRYPGFGSVFVTKPPLCFHVRQVSSIFMPASFSYQSPNDMAKSYKPLQNDDCLIDHKNAHVPLIGSQFLTVDTRWCPSSLAKLVQISPITFGFMEVLSTVNENYKPRNISLGVCPAASPIFSWDSPL